METPKLTKKENNKLIDEIEEEVGQELNERQKAFVRGYTWDWNAAKAYKKAYDIEDETVAAVNASRLLKNANVQKYVRYCRDHSEEIVGISKAKLAAELHKIANCSIAQLHNTWITLKEFEDLSPDDKSAIQSIETQTRTEEVNKQLIKVDYVKVKLYSKQAAIETLNKMYGYNQAEKIDLTNSDNSLANLSTEDLLKRSKAIEKI